MSKWEEGKYSFSYLVLSPSVKGVVRWEKDGYKGSFMGLELVKAFSDASKAKKAVERFAKRHLTKLLEKLENDNDQH